MKEYILEGITALLMFVTLWACAIVFLSLYISGECDVDIPCDKNYPRSFN